MNYGSEAKEIANQPRFKNLNLKLILTCNIDFVSYQLQFTLITLQDFLKLSKKSAEVKY